MAEQNQPTPPPPVTTATAGAPLDAAQILRDQGAIPPPPSADPQAAPAESSAIDQQAIDAILQKARAGRKPPADAAPAEASPASPVTLQAFEQVIREAQASSIDLLRDVDLNVKIELGRSSMLVEDVLRLGEGSVVELDKLAGDPVDVFVNDRLVARGEVLVLNDNFCVRINEIVAVGQEEGA
jgi:flagellar motor switch protein FliN